MNEAIYREIAKLRARNEYLEAELALFKDEGANIKIVALRSKFNISAQEADVLLKLSDGRPVSRYWLSDHVARKSDPEYNLASVLICRLRRRMKPLEIKTLWGTGYQLEGENLDAVRAVIGGAQ